MLGLPVFAMLPDDYPELYECYAEGRLLPRNSDLAKHMAPHGGETGRGRRGAQRSGGGKRLFGFFG